MPDALVCDRTKICYRFSVKTGGEEMKNLMEVITMKRLNTMCISFIIVSLMFAGQSYAKVDPATILGAWLFDEGTGNIAADASGNGNDGTLMGAPAWVAGQSGTALRFTGSGTYVTCGNPETFNINVFSVSFWYNIPATQGWNHMVSRGSHVGSGTPGSVNWGVMMYDAQQTILYETYNNTGWTGIDTNTTIGVWHHVVATYDGTTMQLYHDGQLAGTSAAGILLDPSRPFVIGARSDAGSPAPDFNGSIDEVGYFSAVLTAEDVQMLMTDGLASITGNPRARRPDPKDGASVAQTWLSLGWAAGDSAVSHDVYVGDNFDDVNSGTGTFRSNVATPFFLVGLGMPGDPYPNGLVPGTTYYWRIDEVNPADPNSPWKGKVWSFSVPPRKAYNPNPASGAKYVATDVALSWTAGLGARLHYVYFGDNLDTVSNATGGAPRGTTTYTPAGPLAKGKTYYWRVDEFDAAATHKGDVWSFTTVPDIAITNPDLVGWWKFDEGQGKKALDFSGHGNDGTLGGDPLWVEGVMDGGLYLSGNDYVVIDGVDNDITGTNMTLSIWIKTTQSGEGELFALNDSSGSYALLFGIQGGNPYRWDTADEQYPPAVNDDQWHMLTYVRNGSTASIYVDGVQRVTQSSAFTLDTVTRWSIGQEWDTSPSDFYTGIVDDARMYNKALTADEVKQLTRGDLLRAWSPSPPNWSTVGIERAASLTWSRGDKASQHDVYFGLDKAAVANAAASDTTGIYRGRQSATSYIPSEGVQFSGGPYYWRIDEVNTDGTITTGGIWNFSVGGYALVEDFESYNDVPAGQAGSNLVYTTWLDGYGTTTNGSTMGYPTGSSLETTTVHGGTKAVPLIYNNSTASFSEVERTFAVQNWTSNGIQTLSLWFHGASTNVPGQLYVKINGVKVLYDGDASNLKKPVWQVWNINLASVAVNLQSVTRLAIGIETKGTSGTLLLDDIRLYALPRQLITPVQPAATGLAARFAFEGNANDSAGGHNGTPNGGPTYAAGKFGQAINLDGTNDYVVVGSVGISGAAPRTIAGWAKMNVTTGIPDWTNVFGFSATGSNNLHFDIEVVGGGTTTAGYYGIHVYGWERNIMPPDLGWHHFAATYDGTTISWYGDGLLIGSAAHPGLNTQGDVRIGKRIDTGGFFPGLVDEVQIYSRVLSEAEVAGLAGMTLPFDKPF
jgi:hypothetical protein